MGCDESLDNCYVDGYSWPTGEVPVHTITLSAYEIDKYEVTNARYANCVTAGGCSAPWTNRSNTRTSYYGDAEFANYPVIYVNWFQADEFCKWEGKRLPTEAEWEKAARGIQDTRKFPWGDAVPDCTRANYQPSCTGDTSPVDAYPSGVSPFGVMNMSGNVWEWVNDWYQGDYYYVSPAIDPQGPSTGEKRVWKGGAWYYWASYARITYRNRSYPEGFDHSVGFRCARSVP